MTSKWIVAPLLAAGLALWPGCGARTGLDDPGGSDECRRDSDCGDGDERFCEGIPICQDGQCRDGPAPVCDDFDPCTEDACSDELETCIYTSIFLDWDGDGWESAECGGDDCDDLDREVHPEAPERCNDLDDDCDSEIDELEPPRRIAEASLESLSFGHDLAWGEDHFFYAWHAPDDWNGSPLRLARLTPWGAPIGDPVETFENTTQSTSPALAWSGEVLALAFHDISVTDRMDSLHLDRYDLDSRPLDPSMVISGSVSEPRTPRLAWSGSSFGALYRHGHFSSGTSQIAFTSVDEAGEAIAFHRPVADDRGDSYEPRIVWTGSAFAAAWLEEADGRFEVRLTLLDGEGAPLIGTVVVAQAETYPWALDMAWTEETLVLAWTEMVYPFGSQLRYTVVTPEGDPLRPRQPLGPEAEGSTEPVLIWTGSELALIWLRYLGPLQASTPAELRFARADAFGEPLDEPVSLTPPESFSRRPAAAWSGREVGVAWLDNLESEGQGVYFTRVCRP